MTDNQTETILPHIALANKIRAEHPELIQKPVAWNLLAKEQIYELYKSKKLVKEASDYLEWMHHWRYWKLEEEPKELLQNTVQPLVRKGR